MFLIVFAMYWIYIWTSQQRPPWGRVNCPLSVVERWPLYGGFCKSNVYGSAHSWDEKPCVSSDKHLMIFWNPVPGRPVDSISRCVATCWYALMIPGWCDNNNYSLEHSVLVHFHPPLERRVLSLIGCCSVNNFCCSHGNSVCTSPNVIFIGRSVGWSVGEANFCTQGKGLFWFAVVCFRTHAWIFSHCFQYFCKAIFHKLLAKKVPSSTNWSQTYITFHTPVRCLTIELQETCGS